MYIKIREKILIFFLLLFSIYCAIIIGESWDEAFHFEQGKITLNYLFSLGKINKDFEFSEYYSPSYWSFQYLVSQIFSSNYQIQIIHLVNLSVSLATIVGIGKLAKEFFNSEVA